MKKAVTAGAKSAKGPRKSRVERTLPLAAKWSQREAIDLETVARAVAHKVGIRYTFSIALPLSDWLQLFERFDSHFKSKEDGKVRDVGVEWAVGDVIESALSEYLGLFVHNEKVVLDALKGGAR